MESERKWDILFFPKVLIMIRGECNGVIADIKGADMRNKWTAAIAAISLVALLSIGSFAQQRGRGGRGEGAGALEVPTNKTSFWSNEDIQNRWKDNETKKTINSRLFDALYNISTNVRIVLPDDPPQTHETTADLWIMTAGTAVAETDGEMADNNGAKAIRNGMRRAVHPGDILYIPPGVPHHFVDPNGFRAVLVRFDTIQDPHLPTRRTAAAAPEGRGGAAAAVADAPANKTSFWTSDDIQNRWKNNEAKKAANSRLFNAPYSASANVRIVLPDDPPLTHDDGTADLWLVTAGTATAETDGQVDGKTIRNGVRRPVHTGDVLYVPPGVPHHFIDVNGFRALLIRFATN
jgi:mannose-6-phosphate isomerase-like protein (cupin superfamily)